MSDAEISQLQDLINFLKNLLDTDEFDGHEVREHIINLNMMVLNNVQVGNKVKEDPMVYKFSDYYPPKTHYPGPKGAA